MKLLCAATKCAEMAFEIKGNYNTVFYEVQALTMAYKEYLNIEKGGQLNAENAEFEYDDSSDETDKSEAETFTDTITTVDSASTKATASTRDTGYATLTEVNAGFVSPMLHSIKIGQPCCSGVD